MNNTRVVIVSDHEILREGLRQLLVKQEDLQLTVLTENSETAFSANRDLNPDVIILITSLPESSGIEALANVRDIFLDAKVILLTNDNDGDYLHQALNNGVHGYVTNLASSSEIMLAVRTVTLDQYYLSPSIQNLVVRTYMEGTRTKPRGNNPNAHLFRGFNQLTSREKQVFQFLVAGYSSTQISKKLDISSKTIDKHRANIYKKVGVDNPVQMLQYAYRIGVCDSPGLAHQP
jgi:DNA-binding NarL/FixJ family response regulator